MDPAGTAQSWRRQGELVFILFPVKVAPSGQRYREAHARLNTGRVVPGSALRAPGSRHVPAPRAVPLLGPSAPGCSMLQLEQRKPEGRLGHAVVPGSKSLEKEEKLRGSRQADVKGITRNLCQRPAGRPAPTGLNPEVSTD